MATLHETEAAAVDAANSKIVEQLKAGQVSLLWAACNLQDSGSGGGTGGAWPDQRRLVTKAMALAEAKQEAAGLAKELARQEEKYR